MVMIGTPGTVATVSVNGREFGRTPVLARAPLLAPGTHLLSLLVDGRTYEYTLTVPWHSQGVFVSTPVHEKRQ